MFLFHIHLYNKDSENNNDCSETVITNNHLAIIKLSTSLHSIEGIFEELKNEFGNIQSDFKLLGERLSRISKLMNFVYTREKDCPEFFTENELKYYSKFSEFTKVWSQAYMKQIEFAKENLQELFGYFHREYYSYNEIIDDYLSSRKNFSNFKRNLTDKKEKYYKLLNLEKWDLSNEDIINRESFIGNKEECMKRMLRTETKQLEALENRYYFLSHQVLKEYSKLRKYLNNLLLTQNNKMADENKTILADVFNMVKLITMSIL